MLNEINVTYNDSLYIVTIVEYIKNYQFERYYKIKDYRDVIRVLKYEKE